ncbi:MAG: hypothetical protein ACLQVL_26390 [Terriglobia bacterium]
MGTRSAPTLPGDALTPWLIALGGAALLLALRDSKRLPAALVLLILGIMLGVVLQAGKLPPMNFGPLPLHLLHPKVPDLSRVLPLLVIPQFALTFGNSIMRGRSLISHQPDVGRVAGLFHGRTLLGLQTHE